MLPFLFSHTAIETPTYYALYMLAYLGAILLGSHRARRYNLSPVTAIDTGIVSLVGGVLGARLFHIFFERPDYYLEHPVRIFYLWQGGFVLFGGLIIGTLACIAFLKWKKENILRWADLAAASMFLGMGIGRMGCLSAGCCYGKPTEWSWGMIFTDPRSGAPLHVPLHPTQLLESVFAFSMAGIFWYLTRRPPKKEGTAIYAFFFIYSLFRFCIEFLRGDEERGLYFDGLMSTSQLISLVLAAVAGLLLLKTRLSTKVS